jgi:hypothetical protein
MRIAAPIAIATAALSLGALSLGALGLGELPASAATAGGPRVHDFSVPGVPGVSAWGSYARSDGAVTITLCVKDSSAKVSLALVIGVAMNATYTKHQDITAGALGDNKQACRSVTTTDTFQLSVLASSVGHDGASTVGKLKTIY